MIVAVGANVVTTTLLLAQHGPCSRLDDELDGRGVSLVWIEAHGHEAYVSAGAPNLLSSSTPVVLE